MHNADHHRMNKISSLLTAAIIPCEKKLLYTLFGMGVVFLTSLIKAIADD